MIYVFLSYFVAWWIKVCKFAQYLLLLQPLQGVRIGKYWYGQRAIENLSYVIAADQGGYHVNGRETYGDSMVIDPWGVVVSRKGSGVGVVVAEMDIAQLEKTREVFPCLTHKR